MIAVAIVVGWVIGYNLAVATLQGRGATVSIPIPTVFRRYLKR